VRLTSLSCPAKSATTLLLFFAVYGALPLRSVAAAESTSLTIDQSDALRIGSLHVSHYLVDKFHQRFADGVSRKQNRPPTPSESRRWLEMFVAKETLIAEAEVEGFSARPEVVEMVARMERNMLTTDAGPYYEQLLGKPALLSQEELNSLYVETTAVRKTG